MRYARSAGARGHHGAGEGRHAGEAARFGGRYPARGRAGAPLASWALCFAGSLPNVIAVLSGMNTPEMVAENAAIMRDGVPLTPAEYEVIDAARAALESLPGVPCTDCRYCVKGCPEGVHINNIMQSLNIYDQMGDAYRAHGELRLEHRATGRRARASSAAPARASAPSTSRS